MKVVFLDTVHPVLQSRLTAEGFRCEDASESDRETCLKQIVDAQGLVIRARFTLDASFLNHAKELKFIARSGAGLENIDSEYCKNRGIQLFNAPEGNRNAVAEHALAMLLALFNKIVKADREVRAGTWDREGNRGIELDGKTVGIIGYGNNGRAFAQKLQGFNCRILAYDKYKTGFSDDKVTESDLQTLFNEVDVVSFHIPQNEETLWMADQHFFESFRKKIYLINLSRGKIVRTKALVAGLKEGKIAGACLDVLEYESSSFEDFFKADLPEEFQYLIGSDRVLFSPHVGGWTEESYVALSNVLADKILAKFR